MPLMVVQPPKDEAKFAEVGQELYAAVKQAGMAMEPQGFLLSWVGGTRVVVERDDAGAIVGIALVTIGQRWVQNDFTATVLFFAGSEALFDFVIQVASALGARSLYRETGQLTKDAKKSTFEITEYHLQ